MTTDLTKYEPQERLSQAIEKVLMTGDLMPLTPEQRIQYHNHVCDSVGLNRAYSGLRYLNFQNKLIQYAGKETSDQLRKIHAISIKITSRERLPGDLYVVTAHAVGRDGRHDESTGVVHLARLQGDALANIMMKCETKAKRRVTLSYTGLSLLDETEVATMKGAIEVAYDYVPPIKGANNEMDSAETTPGNSFTVSNITAAKSASEAPKKQTKIFDAKDEKAVDWLRGILTERKLSSDEHELFIEAMDGKDFLIEFEPMLRKKLEGTGN